MVFHRDFLELQGHERLGRVVEGHGHAIKGERSLLFLCQSLVQLLHVQPHHEALKGATVVVGDVGREQAIGEFIHVGEKSAPQVREYSTPPENGVHRIGDVGTIRRDDTSFHEGGEVRSVFIHR